MTHSLFGHRFGGGGVGDVTAEQLAAAVMDLQKDHGEQTSLVAANAIPNLNDGDIIRIADQRYSYDPVASSFVLANDANWFSIPVDVSGGDVVYDFDPNGFDGKTYNVFRVDDGNQSPTATMTIDISNAAGSWRFEHIGISAGTDITTEEIGGQFDLYVDDAAKLVRIRRYGTTATSGGGGGGSSSGIFPIAGWSVTQSLSADRQLNTNSATQQEIADVLGTLIEDLRASQVLTT